MIRGCDGDDHLRDVTPCSLVGSWKTSVHFY